MSVQPRGAVVGRTPSKMLWSEYAASLFEAKVADGAIQSAASRRRWADTLARLVPRFGRYNVDDLRPADFVEWRSEVARWILNGMPSRRKREAGKLVPLSPVVNGRCGRRARLSRFRQPQRRLDLPGCQSPVRKESLVLTTNLAFADWHTVFPSATCATALVERVVHHADIVKIDGESYRLRESKQDADSRDVSRRDRKKPSAS